MLLQNVYMLMMIDYVMSDAKAIDDDNISSLNKVSGMSVGMNLKDK